MDDEADSRGPAPPSWPEGIDPEELERQRFQLRKFERVHKQLHTHSNGGTKRKIQGKGTDTGVTRLLRNRSLVASHWLSILHSAENRQHNWAKQGSRKSVRL